MTARRVAGALMGLALLTAVTGAIGGDTAEAGPLPTSAELTVQKVGELVDRDATVSYRSTDQSITVHHPGATYVKVRFAGLDLAPGDRLTVSDPEGVEVHTYHGAPGEGWRDGDSDYTLHENGVFAALSIEGDTAVVEIHRADDDLDAKPGGVQIDGYWRGYDQAEYEAANPGIESVCGVEGRRDSICYQSSHPTEYQRSRAVGRLLMGGSACTAFRVGDTNRLLTNNHCMSTQSAIAGSETQFDYECATCGGNNPKTPTKVSGATMHKTSSQLDYTLYSVNSFSSITGFGTLYLETRQPVLNERIYIPGHGDAAPKRLSVTVQSGGANCKIDQVQYLTINTGYMCDTSGGSSGSPVIAGSSHKVIALHRIGGCLNGGTRMSLIYPEIAGLISN
ncbi:trypsin-like peptidase [Stackebrandtia albiflava]|uniref:Trypsin-like peptidase n=1 Tax=Stackebrandtia albiflava TaxID=406432 RepID=A0A562V2E5_9ACTN|nr:serine protease [Stackebrandtia albiflava]TWJ12056.1 trypsin-like peptidase [Stackebrandtia albiflava]